MSSILQPIPPPARERASDDGLRAECPRHDANRGTGILPGAKPANLQHHVIHSTHDEREELYTATFDVNPRCVPYVSIHLFGEENFKRGEFMAALHSQYEQAGFATGGELPDHLAILLRYAATLGEPARRELVEFCLLGPLAKIIQALPEDHPYRFVLEAVDETLRSHYPGIEAPLSPLEQMRQHGICPTVSDGCHCGPAASAIVDGPRDIDSPAEASAPFLSSRSTPTP